MNWIEKKGVMAVYFQQPYRNLRELAGIYLHLNNAPP